MPTYEYTCIPCDAIKKVTRGINDNSDSVLCDSCEQEMKRVYSVGAVTFKGSGFYSKDK